MRDNCTRFSLCPRPCGLDYAVSVEPVSRRIGEPRRRPDALNAPVLSWLMRGLDGFLERDRALFDLAPTEVSE